MTSAATAPPAAAAFDTATIAAALAAANATPAIAKPDEDRREG